MRTTRCSRTCGVSGFPDVPPREQPPTDPAEDLARWIDNDISPLDENMDSLQSGHVTASSEGDKLATQIRREHRKDVAEHRRG
jgi:hypothetical protein